MLTTWWNFPKRDICTNRWETTVELGNWRVSVNVLDRLWPFHYSKAKDILYQSYWKHWFSHTDYEYVAILGNLPGVYAFEFPHNVCHKVSALHPDAVPCDVEDHEHRWRILDHQPLNVPPIKQCFHYNLRHVLFFL